MSPRSITGISGDYYRYQSTLIPVIDNPLRGGGVSAAVLGHLLAASVWGDLDFVSYLLWYE